MNRRLWLLMTGLVFTAACGHRHTEDPGPISAPGLVEVTNNYGLPMEIFAVGTSTRQRLGLVNPGMVSRFEIPANLINGGAVVFQAIPTAPVHAQQYRSGELFLNSGTVVELEIAAVLFNSTATIRP